MYLLDGIFAFKKISNMVYVLDKIINLVELIDGFVDGL